MYTLILAYITITSFISDDSEALSFTEDSTKSTQNVKWFHLKEIINCGRILKSQYGTDSPVQAYYLSFDQVPPECHYTPTVKQ